MWMTLESGPYSFRMVPEIVYRRLPDCPAWESDLHLDLLLPSLPPGETAPVVVYFHGGGWEQGGREHGLHPWINPLLASHGFITASVSYRLSHRDPFPAQLADARAAVAWLRSAAAAEFGIDRERIGVWGDSAGAHLALLLACEDPESQSSVQAVVARAAPSDFDSFHLDDEDVPGSVLYKLFGGPNSSAEEARRAASPFHLVDSLDIARFPPCLLVHGTRDDTVPFAQSANFVDKVTSLGGHASLRPVHEGFHGMTSDPHRYWANHPWESLGREAAAFFHDHLGGPRAACGFAGLPTVGAQAAGD